ncbi:hypothetical protein CQ018_19270 [Arthrobacter sp. MYb227]|uniref:hypothetical protein n=1 Tax=Arthrobacter sp. MYb227 TaxID=1848601 RepID=UPI000CFAD4AD|nr:hypothetical protein [Arthrobacter sp. MYb227]PQZ86201.1 hypothetical protein CQ018_19270 [Arthrobacter sp. MYb227]
MRIEEWWPLLEPDTRSWLIVHNGDAIPQPIIDEIRAVEGVATADMSWVGAKIPAGFFLSDDAVDWIEAVANEETPESS